MIDRLLADRQVVLRYAAADGSPAGGAFPLHPNGSLQDLAGISFEKGEREKARHFAASIDQGEKEYDDASNILAKIQFLDKSEKSGDKETCLAELEKNPDDLEARYKLALCLAAGEDYKSALDQLLLILEKDKGYKDKAAHQAVLSIFSTSCSSPSFIMFLALSRIESTSFL